METKAQARVLNALRALQTAMPRGKTFRVETGKMGRKILTAGEHRHEMHRSSFIALENRGWIVPVTDSLYRLLQ